MRRLAWLLLIPLACEARPSAAPATRANPSSPAVPKQVPHESPTNVSPPSSVAPEPPPPPPPPPQTVLHTGQAGPLHYAEFMTGGAKFEDKVPVIVAIHGLGDSPQGFAGLLKDFDRPARVLLPRGIDAYQGGWSWFPLRARDPNVDSLAEGISRASEVISEGMRAFAQTRPEAESFVLTGFSQGGMLTFTLAVQHPEQVSSAVAVGGWLPPPLWPKTTPPAAPKLVALHGIDDPAVKFPPTEAAVDSLKAVGWPVELHAYPGVRHAIPPLMRDELFTLLSAATQTRATQLEAATERGGKL